MRTYWLKIVLGSLVVFGVGYSVVFAVRRFRIRVSPVSTGGVSLPMNLVGFTVDGARFGSVSRVQVARGQDGHPGGIRLRVRLDEPLGASLEGCRFVAQTIEGIETGAEFRCVREGMGEVAGLSEFGVVQLESRAGSVREMPLLFPVEVKSGLLNMTTSNARESVSTSSDRAVSSRYRAEARSLADSLSQLESQGNRSP